jgi:membrane protein YdbS with pleckstrin-like domain
MKDQLQEGEEVIFVAQPSKMPLLPLGILALLAVIAAIIATVLFAPLVWPPPLAIGLATLVIIWLIARLMVLNSNKYVLTNRRVIRQGGVFSRNSVDSYLEKINNVEHRQTFWGRIFGYGDVEIDTASETGMTRFLMIANPLGFKNAITQAMEQYRMARSGGIVTPISGAQKIRELKTLLDEGLISNEEYEAKRKALLENM